MAKPIHIKLTRALTAKHEIHPKQPCILFGDEKKITAIESITFPAKIGGEHINIQSDILDNDILLLFSQSSMKTAEMKINFQNDTINLLGENIPLAATTPFP